MEACKPKADQSRPKNKLPLPRWPPDFHGVSKFSEAWMLVFACPRAVPFGICHFLDLRDNKRPFLRAIMKPQVEIYDTTLRDGSQAEGINFSVADKLRIAEKLDTYGVHYIEGGWPGSNPKDIEFFAQAKKRKFKNARLAAFGSTRKKNKPVESD